MSHDEALSQALAAQAALRGYPYPERLERWVARLSMNRPEQERLAAAPEPAEPPLHLQPAPPASAAGLMDGSGRLAAAARLTPEEAEARFAGALQRAAATRDLNAFITLADPAETPAEVTGEGLPLRGALLAIKDLMAVRGFPLTGGSRALPDTVPAEDALCVARLRAAGARVLGTANLHELAYGITSANPHYGTVVNPAAPGRIAGGSSGGSAAAVAAGLVDAALGTDTAGSIRIPAACCGVVGFKPSFGAIPVEGVVPLGWSLDTVGPLAASVADAARLFDVMTAAPPAPAPAAPLELSRLTLVRPARYFFDYLDPAVRLCIDQALARLAAAGARVVERHIDHLEYAAAAQFATLMVEASQNHFRLLLETPEGLGEDVRVRLEVGQFIAGVDYQKAQRLRSALRNAMQAAVAGPDELLVTPTLPVPAPPLGAASVAVGEREMPVHTAMTRCTAPFNLTGMPAITLPCGRDPAGVPIGLQLVAAGGRDTFLLAAAQAVETALNGNGAPA